MFGWLDFFIIFFWLSLGLFTFNLNNFITILLFAELTWLILYTLTMLVGSIVNEITITSLSFFILGFGGLEFVVGLMLLVVMRNFNVNLQFDDLNSLLSPNSTNATSNKKWIL